jgi:hypothetical protein
MNPLAIVGIGAGICLFVLLVIELVIELLSDD